MNNLKSLVSRDIKIFYRTKGNIIFATLAVIILVVLHFVVFRNMFTDNWVHIASQFPNLVIEREKLQWLTDSLMFAAILPIGAVSISLVALGLMVADKENNVLSDFLVSPIKRNSLMSSYLISSFIVGALILVGFIVFFEIFFLTVYGFGFGIVQIVYILLTTLGSLVFANVFLMLIISFFKTQQSLGAVGTITGTMIGFLSGAYISVGMFGETIRNVFSFLPFLQLTVLSRQAFLYDLEKVTPIKMEMLTGDLARDFGIELWIGDTLIPIWGVVLMTAGITLALLIPLIIRFAGMKKK